MLFNVGCVLVVVIDKGHCKSVEGLSEDIRVRFRWRGRRRMI